jgi:hypothetical protein
MVDPLFVGEGVEPHRRRRALVAIAQDMFGKTGGLDLVEEGIAEGGMRN